MTENRNSLRHKISRAMRRPALIVPYFRRRLRNRRIRARVGAAGHAAFYRQVMADDVATKAAHGAVGTGERERWLAIGKKQFDYLVSHRLEPSHRLLEIGCGNLRAGWRLVSYLDPGHYVGVDISPEILLAAEEAVVEYGLQDKMPSLMLVDGTNLGFLPASHFDVVHAHSVFTHTPLEVVEAYLREAWRVMKPGAFFDFTYHESDDGIWGFLDEDYYFPTATLLDIAARLGFKGRVMDDWEYVQAKIRVVKQTC